MGGSCLYVVSVSFPLGGRSCGIFFGPFSLCTGTSFSLEEEGLFGSFIAPFFFWCTLLGEGFGGPLFWTPPSLFTGFSLLGWEECACFGTPFFFLSISLSGTREWYGYLLILYSFLFQNWIISVLNVIRNSVISGRSTIIAMASVIIAG